MSNLENFVNALVNYNLFHQTKLVKYGLNFFVAMNQCDFEKAKKYRKKLIQIIWDLDLADISDFDPILMNK